MKKLGQNPAYGCGTAMWEYEPELDQMGTPDALMLLPYWTNGCIGSEEGLYYESSATTPYHFLNVAELSDQPSDPVVGLHYPAAPNVPEGIQHLQMLGVKYFMAETPDIEAAADKDTNLHLVGTVGPFPVTYTTGSTSTVEQRTWKIYEIADSATVTPLQNQPVVVTGRDQIRSNRDQAGSVRMAQGLRSLVPQPLGLETSSKPSPGRKAGHRVSPSTTTLPKTQLPPVQVTDIKKGTESISFNVDQTGVPVLVKTSYFPNWQVSGASDIYRVTPNLMVVVPTANHVTLTYGYTPVDWIGFILSLLGLAGLVVLWRLGPVRYTRPRHLRGFDSDERWDGKAGPTSVPVRMTAPSPLTLASIFKAYDIRGTVPDQLEPGGGPRRRLGVRPLCGCAPDPGGEGYAALGCRLGAVVRRRRVARGRRRGRSGFDVHRRAVLRVREPRRARTPCSPPPTTRPSTTGSSSAWRAPARSARKPVSARSWRRPRRSFEMGSR